MIGEKQLTNRVQRQFVNEHQASELTGLAVSTLRNYRHQGKGPVYYKPGGKRVLYERNELLLYIESYKVEPT